MHFCLCFVSVTTQENASFVPGGLACLVEVVHQVVENSPYARTACRLQTARWCAKIAVSFRPAPTRLKAAGQSRILRPECLSWLDQWTTPSPRIRDSQLPELSATLVVQSFSLERVKRDQRTAGRLKVTAVPASSPCR